VHAQPLIAFTKVRFDETLGPDSMFGSLDDALDRAREILGLPPTQRPVEAEAEVARDRAPPVRNVKSA